MVLYYLNLTESANDNELRDKGDPRGKTAKKLEQDSPLKRWRSEI